MIFKFLLSIIAHTIIAARISTTNLKQNPDLAIQLTETGINRFIKFQGPTITNMIKSLIPFKFTQSIDFPLLDMNLHVFGGELSNITIDFNRLTFDVLQDNHLTIHCNLTDILLKLNVEFKQSFPSYDDNMTIDFNIPMITLNLDLTFINNPKHAIGMDIKLSNFTIENKLNP